ncbi:MAG: rhomboid family intramembrane serine protease [Rubricoccaceae bacterium]|nr:rhomboid family intramembrane serine protease [Rubricoccaceae bacterium]
MLFPISDDDRHLDGPAYVTIALVLLNVIVFVLFQGLGANEGFTYGWSVVPAEITTGTDLTQPTTVGMAGERVTIPHAPGPVPIYLTLLSAMFMHGGFGHIGGNLLYLWIFGDNVEHRFGSGAFLAFYLVSGVAATFVQILLDPDSVIPNLGASGAISGVLGAYLVLFPKNRVHAVFFYTIIAIPAVLALGFWIALQFINGFGAIAATEQTGGVAYGAHIGGFAAGVVLALVLRTLIPEERPNVLRSAMQRDPRTRPLW